MLPLEAQASSALPPQPLRAGCYRWRMTCIMGSSRLYMYPGVAFTSSLHSHVTSCSLRTHHTMDQRQQAGGEGGGLWFAGACSSAPVCPWTDPMRKQHPPVRQLNLKHGVLGLSDLLDLIKPRLDDPPDGLGLALQHVEALLQQGWAEDQG